LLDLLKSLLLGPFADGDHGDNCGYAEYDTQHSEHGAHFVG
jgi:hypothetical protein